MFEQYDDILTLDEVCEALHIGKNTAYELLKSGQLKSFKCGKCYKVPRKCVEDFVIGRCGRGNM